MAAKVLLESSDKVLQEDGTSFVLLEPVTSSAPSPFQRRPDRGLILRGRR